MRQAEGVNFAIGKRGSPETIPAEYNAATTLSFAVELNKKNVANFDLKSGGPVTPR